MGSKHPQGHGRFIELSRTAAMAVFATVLAAPASAGIPLPNDPLTTGSRVPPNILFLLDDSGSMAFETMENPVVPRICRWNGSNCRSGSTITQQTYVGNTVYYDPAIDYKPWVDASGALLTGGTSFDSAYADFNNLTDPIDLGDDDSCKWVSRNGANTRVCGGVQVFYVPKDRSNSSPAYLREATNYYRYRIINGAVERAEWGDTAAGEMELLRRTGLSGDSANPVRRYEFDVPAGASNLVVKTTSGSTRTGQGFDLHWGPSGAVTACSTAQGNQKECSEPSPQEGKWYVELRVDHPGAGHTYSGVTLTVSVSQSSGCQDTSGSVGWINCTPATPTNRTVADEKANYATWFSYHRTRMKAAKAGASAAFSELGNDVRVGFRTIWRRAPSGDRPANEPTQNVPIPVNYNGGLFADPDGPAGANNNRTRWFNRLHTAVGQSGTPLHGALRDAGEYFSSSAANGPYGPETGDDQLACRQNFSILTTDGYWNDYSRYGSSVRVGNQDGTPGERITGPNNEDYTYVATAPYSDEVGDTLADVAMYYWKNDLSPLPNIVPTTVANPAFWQHMVTFGISIGLRGTLDPETDLPRLRDGSLQWPDPTDTENAERIDDLWHAAVNGRGTFLSASNPTDFAEGLKGALATITQRTASFSNVSANSTALDAGNVVFQANYVSGSWTGDLFAFSVGEDGVSTTPSWQASQGIPTSGRKIFTYNGVSGAGFPTDAQLEALERTVAYEVTGEENAAYIAGSRVQELNNGGHLRNRNHLLGDIVSSSPAYSADTNTVFVGANDGMLHAFDAATGNELFAYIPNAINWANLSTLSRPDYGHRFFVDGPVVVSDRTQTPDQNILVGSLGRGGKGLFALDVTAPDAFTSSDVLWERTETPMGNMGLVLGRPIIARLNSGVTALIVSNGVNSSHDRAVLLVYDLATGDLLKEIDTGAGSAENPNGLSAPVGWDVDGSGTLDVVYAGDLLGNVWKFDLSSVASPGWAVANGGAPLFTAEHGAGASRTSQPITGGLSVAMHPSTYKTWLFFGTGRFMTIGDLTNRDVQSMYGIVDEGAAVTKADLTKRQITVVGTKDGRQVRGFEAQAPLPPTSKGWYVDLLTPPDTAEGERIITDTQVVGDVLVTSSIIPTADACQSDGKGFLNALDAFTGTSTGPAFFDLDGDGRFDDETIGTGDNEVPIGSVDLGIGMPTLGALLRGRIVAGGSGGGTGSVATRHTRNTGRVSWREVRGE